MPNPVLKLASLPASFYKWGTTIGWQAAWTWTLHQISAALGFAQSTVLSLKPDSTRHPVQVRLGDSSDFRVFRQIFQFQEYACMRDLPDPRVILDLGANVGYASAYFLSRYPQARVIAVEPDPGNFEQCRRNLAPYGNRAQVLLGAVWSRRCKLALSSSGFRDGREWSIQVRDSSGTPEDGNVNAWDIPSLLQLAGADSVDLLKVDIERSELEVFNAASAEWLPKVRNICIELHGSDCEEAFTAALVPFDFEPQSSGELTIARNIQLKSSLEPGLENALGRL